MLLIQVIQRCTVIGIEGSVAAIGAGQHPGSRIRAGGRTRNMHSPNGTGAFIASNTTAKGPVHIISMTEANAMAYFMLYDRTYIIHIGIGTICLRMGIHEYLRI